MKDTAEALAFSTQPETPTADKPIPVWKAMGGCLLCTCVMTMCSSSIGFGLKRWNAHHEVTLAQKEKAPYVGKDPQSIVRKDFLDNATKTLYTLDVPAEVFLKRSDERIKQAEEILSANFWDNWQCMAGYALSTGLIVGGLFCMVRNPPEPVKK